MWILDPRRGEAYAHGQERSLSVLDVDGALDGESVHPGFACRLRDVVSRVHRRVL